MRSFSQRSVRGLATLSCMTAVFVGTPSCATEKVAGSVTVAISTDMRAPKDVDAVGLYIWQDGKPAFQHIEAVRSDGSVQFPSTFVVAATTAELPKLRVRLIAFQRQGPNASGRTARVIRDAVTTVPKTRAALLRVPLRWMNSLDSQTHPNPVLSDDFVVTCPQGICDGASLSAMRPVGLEKRDTQGNPYDIERAIELDNGCPLGSGQTLDDQGECSSAEVLEENLPEYRAEEVFGGGRPGGNGSVAGGTCFDVASCFSSRNGGSVVDVAADALASCFIPMPQGALNANVAIRVKDEAGGHANEDGSFVPLDRADWTEEERAGQKGVAVAPGICRLVRAGRGLGLRAAFDVPKCGPKDASQPVCAPAGAVELANTEDPAASRDRPPPVRDAGIDEDVDRLQDASDALRDATEPTARDARGEELDGGINVPDATVDAGDKDGGVGPARDSGNPPIDGSADGGSDAMAHAGSYIPGQPVVYYNQPRFELEDIQSDRMNVVAAGRDTSSPGGPYGCAAVRFPRVVPWFTTNASAVDTTQPLATPITGCQLGAAEGSFVLLEGRATPPSALFDVFAGTPIYPAPAFYKMETSSGFAGGSPTGSVAILPGSVPREAIFPVTASSAMWRVSVAAPDGGAAPPNRADARLGSGGARGVRAGYLKSSTEPGYAVVVDKGAMQEVAWCSDSPGGLCASLAESVGPVQWPTSSLVRLGTPTPNAMSPKVGLAILVVETVQAVTNVRVYWVTDPAKPLSTAFVAAVPMNTPAAGIQRASVATDGTDIFFSVGGQIWAVSVPTPPNPMRGPQLLLDQQLGEPIRALTAVRIDDAQPARSGFFFVDKHNVVGMEILSDQDAGAAPK